MTDRATLKDQVLHLIEHSPSSDADRGWNEAVREVLRLIDAQSSQKDAQESNA